MSLRPLLLAGFVLGVVAVQDGSGQTAKKFALPGPEARDKAAALVHELYRKDLDAAAQDPAAAARLAAAFLQEARETNDYPAGRLVLLESAIRLASTAGDTATALLAIEEKSHHFTVQPSELLAVRIHILTQASLVQGASAANYRNLIDSALLLLEDALTHNDFASAEKLLGAAEMSARKLRNVPLVSALRKRQNEVAKQEKEFAAWKPFADRLATNPDDAQANLEMGVYNAFLKGNWDLGLAQLARGSDPELRALAALEATRPQQADKQIELAERWSKVAERNKDALRPHVWLRAYHWYQEALGHSQLAQRAALEAPMRKIMTLVPAEYRVGAITTELRKIDVPGGPVYGAAFSPDGRKLITGGADGVVRLWDVRTGKAVRQLEGHTGRVWCVAFHPDGRRVVSGGFDGTLRLWDLSSGRELQRLEGHKDYVRAVTVSRDGKHLLSAGDDRVVRLWDVDTGKEIRSFPGHEHFVWSVALSRDGQRALSASLDQTLRLWDVATGKELRVLRGHQDTVLTCALSADGRRGLSGGTDRALVVWDLDTGKELAHTVADTGYPQSVALSPDGTHALSGGDDGVVRLWQLDGKEQRRLEGHREAVWHVAFSPDGRLALSCGQDGTVRLWGGGR